MSADRYSICPWCDAEFVKFVLTTEQQIEAFFKKAKSAVEFDEYRELQRKKISEKEPKETVREDYHFSLDEGEITYSYHASCDVKGCGFNVSFKGSHPFDEIPIDKRKASS